MYTCMYKKNSTVVVVVVRVCMYVCMYICEVGDASSCSCICSSISMPSLSSSSGSDSTGLGRRSAGSGWLGRSSACLRSSARRVDSTCSCFWSSEMCVSVTTERERCTLTSDRRCSQYSCHTHVTTQQVRFAGHALVLVCNNKRVICHTP